MSHPITASLATWWRVVATRTERAASLVEYALLVALIALVCVVAVTQFGSDVREEGFESISTVL